MKSVFVHIMKAVAVSVHTDPLVFIVVKIWSWLVDFKPRSLYFFTHWLEGCVERQSSVGVLEKKKSLLLQEIKQRIPV